MQKHLQAKVSDRIWTEANEGRGGMEKKFLGKGNVIGKNTRWTKRWNLPTEEEEI